MQQISLVVYSHLSVCFAIVCKAIDFLLHKSHASVNRRPFYADRQLAAV